MKKGSCGHSPKTPASKASSAQKSMPASKSKKK